MFQYIGQEMGIADIYGSYEEAEAYMDQYEQQFMRYSSKNRTVAEASVAVALKLYPSYLHGAIRSVLYTLSGPALRDAMVSSSTRVLV